MSQLSSPSRLAIVGRGRLGRALAVSLPKKGYRLVGPLSRDYSTDDLQGVQIVLLCVPDREIVSAATTLAQRLPDDARCPLVGHCSGATPLSALDSLQPAERFSLHPLMTFPDRGGNELLGAFQSEDLEVCQGAGAAVCGSSPNALRIACELASELGLSPFALQESDRAAYHAAASMASNFLITIEAGAERLAASAGCERDALLPLVRQTVENWATQGARALTGPIARGDHATVARQRSAVAERTPELLGLFDVLSEATGELAGDEHSSTAQHPRVKPLTGRAA